VQKILTVGVASQLDGGKGGIVYRTEAVWKGMLVIGVSKAMNSPETINDEQSGWTPEDESCVCRFVDIAVELRMCLPWGRLGDIIIIYIVDRGKAGSTKGEL
jgi:hypothetical protein